MSDEIQNDELENQEEIVDDQLEASQPVLPAPQGQSKKRKRWVWILLGILAFFVVLGAGAAAGGAAAYFWLRHEAPVRQIAREHVEDLQNAPMEFGRGVSFAHAPGVLVTEVVEGGPAEGAGLEAGDWITALDGETVGAQAGLADLLQGYQPGDEVVLTIERDDEEMTLSVALGENPDNAGQAYLGIYYRPVGPDVMLDFRGEDGNFQLPDMPFDEYHGEGQQPFYFHGMGEFQDLPEGYDRAIILGNVLADSPADRAGLQAGDLILAVDDEPVDTVQAFVEGIQAHKPGDRVSVLVFRDGEVTQVQVTLATNPDDADVGYLGVEATGFIRMERNRDQNFEQENEFKIPGDDA